MSGRHFDNISDTYHEEVSTPVREHLIRKFWTLVGHHFHSGARVLDIGCGEGTNTRFLLSKGVDAMGIDASQGLIEAGISRHPGLRNVIAVGDALSLPHENDSFDVCVMIGVLHHIYSPDDQVRAVKEALRVTRPGGCVLIRESNLFNPLFRIYWNYVFPLTAKIDRFGGENWIPAHRLRSLFETEFERVDYFTFIPSFTPSAVLPLAARIETALEGSFLRRLSAHYVLTLRKPAMGSR